MNNAGDRACAVSHILFDRFYIDRLRVMIGYVVGSSAFGAVDAVRMSLLWTGPLDAKKMVLILLVVRSRLLGTLTKAMCA
jgi:hypothetical protein